MAKRQKTEEVRCNEARPNLDELLLHPILKRDNGPAPAGLPPRVAAEAADEDDGERVNGSYKNWSVDHAEANRFYIGGLEAVKAITRQKQARYYEGFKDEAREIANSERWNEGINGAWDAAPSYNQFRNAFILRIPMRFDLSAQVLAACECAVADAVDRRGHKGRPLEVYAIAKIIPACYNIDRFNAKTLADLRNRLPNYDADVLQFASQPNRQVLDELAESSCVTRPTARAIRWRTLQLLDHAGINDIDIGDVRGRPGDKRGQGNASKAEVVERENFSRY